jgi:hypothetical protein
MSAPAVDTPGVQTRRWYECQRAPQPAPPSSGIAVEVVAEVVASAIVGAAFYKEAKSPTADYPVAEAPQTVR